MEKAVKDKLSPADRPLPRRLRKLIEEQQLTKTALAKQIGVTYQSVSLWASGQTVPTADKLEAMANYFHVSTDYLLGREKDDSGIYARCEQLEQENRLLRAVIKKVEYILSALKKQ